MSVIGLEKHAIAEHGDAAIDAGRGVSRRNESRRLWTHELPDLPAGSGIERARFIDRRNVHDAVQHDRRHLKGALASHLVRPFRLELRDVLGVDLIEWAVTIRAEETVVARPLARLRTRDIVERDLPGQLRVRDTGEQPNR